MKTPLELPYRYRVVLCVFLIPLTSATQPPCIMRGSVALRPAISDGLPLSVTDVWIFDMILGGVNRSKAKAVPRELVLAIPTHTRSASLCW